MNAGLVCVRSNSLHRQCNTTKAMEPCITYTNNCIGSLNNLVIIYIVMFDSKKHVNKDSKWDEVQTIQNTSTRGTVVIIPPLASEEELDERIAREDKTWQGLQ